MSFQFIKSALLRCALALLAGSSASAGAQAAGPKLYETGPEQDSAFVRFVNGLDQPVQVVPEDGRNRLVLPLDKPAGDFLTVRPDTVLKGSVEARGQRAAVSVKTAPGAFSTVVARSAGAGKPFVLTVLSETPDDFNALRASLAFANLDASCASAGLQTAGKGVPLFSDMAAEQLQRRSINAVRLTVQATCAGKTVGEALELGQLQAGQRYSILLLPGAGAGTAPRVLFVVDSVAR